MVGLAGVKVSYRTRERPFWVLVVAQFFWVCAVWGWGLA